MNESVEGMKVIKFNAWEDVLSKAIKIIRKPEMNIVFKIHILNGIMFTIGIITTGLIIIITFPIYNETIEPLTVAKSYSIITILK